MTAAWRAGIQSESANKNCTNAGTERVHPKVVLSFTNPISDPSSIAALRGGTAEG
jgi:hypothetical protein